MSAQLRLLAEDATDLEVIAAAAQDALLKMADIVYDKKTRRFTLMINRFRWEAVEDAGPYERVRAGLSFEGVLNVRARKVRQDAPEALASILSVTFLPADEPPGGEVRIVLAGGGEVSLEVECLDVTLVDLAQAWRTPRRPDHEKA